MLTRMASRGSDAFVDYEVGRPSLRRIGSFRPVIGAVFAVVLYFALRSGLVQLTVDSASDQELVYFYAALAFVAGFSERRARLLLGSATKMLGGDDEEQAQEKAKSPPNKAAEGSSA